MKISEFIKKAKKLGLRLGFMKFIGYEAIFSCAFRKAGSDEPYAVLPHSDKYWYADPLIISTLMDGINPNHYRMDQIENAVCWRTGDGTSIYQFFYGSDSFAVMYVSAEMGTGQYQVNGL